MSIELIIDNREHKLIKELKTTHEITVEQLPLGDIVFRRDGEIILIIERKTILDLRASICDGRGREQKARLLGSGTPTDRIMYLIEGDMDIPLKTKLRGIPASTLVGCLINTQLRDNIKVYKTSSLAETANFIRKMLDKLEKDGDKYFQDGEKRISASQYSATLKKHKKSNMTPEVWFISQLSLIPQVTEKVAAEIIKVYPSVSLLMLEYERIPEHLRSKLLADITFPIKGNKTRRVGDKMSTRIYKFLYGIE